MMMPEKELFQTFANRTWQNFLWMKEELKKRNESGKMEKEKPPFEITQMINSMLGLLVFQKEQNAKEFPSKDIDLEHLRTDGWPLPIRIEGDIKPATLWGIITMLRHSIAHGGIKLIPDKNNSCEIGAVRFINKRYQDSKKIEWAGEMSVTDLEIFLDKLHALLVSRCE